MKWKLIIILIIVGMLSFPLVNATIYADKYEWQVTYSDDEDYEVYIENKNNIGTTICLYNTRANILTAVFMPLEINIYNEYDREIAKAEKELISKEDIKTDKNYYGYCEWFGGNQGSYLRFGEKSTIFEFIKVIKASHLDSRRDFIADVYGDVKERDNNWTNQINESQYLRITFEQELTNINDITIYARSTGKESTIEVYEKDKDELIAVFENVLEDKKYQIYLNNLNGSQNTFDLKVLNNAVEFDYIIDPTNDFYVVELDDRITEWQEFGDDPYLDEIGESLIGAEAGALEHGDFNFSALPEKATSINSVNFYIYAMCDGTAFRLIVHVWDSGTSTYSSDNLGDCGSASWKTFSVPTLTTVEEVNNAKFYVESRCRVKAGCTGGASGVYSAFLRVDYITELIPPDISFDSSTDEDGTIKITDNIFINISASDENNISTFIDFDDSLIMWMRMDDINGSGDPSDYFGIHNGTAYGDAIRGFGFLGNGFAFDGDGDYINISDDARLKFGADEDFSISLWFKTPDADDNMLFSKSNYGEIRYRMFIYDGKVRSNLKDGTNNYLSLGGSVDDNQWHHVVGVYDRDVNGTLYVDGVQVDTDDLSGVGDIDFEAPLFIGSRGDTEDFNGFIDDFMIFNRTLTANEVYGLYANKSSEYLQINYTNLAEGEHTFIAYTQDTAGNVNMTETRIVTTGSCWSWDFRRLFISNSCKRIDFGNILNTIF